MVLLENKPNQKLTKTELAYIAGIIDGEGCIQILRRRAKKGQSKTGYEFGLKITISNSHKELIELLHEKLGGYIFIAQPKCPNRQPSYQLCISSKGVRWLVPQLIPFTRGKLAECEIIQKAFPLINQGHSQDYSAIRTLQKEIQQLHGKTIGRRDNNEP